MSQFPFLRNLDATVAHATLAGTSATFACTSMAAALVGRVANAASSDPASNRKRALMAYPFTWLFLVALSAAGAVIELPDPSTGVIDGRTAVLVWPARYKTLSDLDLIPADGCNGHFVPASDLNAELVYPCGTWFRPAAGRYKGWLEGNGYISPFPSVLNYAGEPFSGRGLTTVMPVVSSGQVSIPDDVTVPPNTNVRLFSLETVFYGRRQLAFDRRVQDARRPAALPTGKAIAGIFDRQTNDAIALSKPFTVLAGKTVIVRPAPPTQGSDIFVVLQRPHGTGSVEPRLHDGTSRAPDVLVNGTNGVYAVWYGINARRVRLTAEGDGLFLPPKEIALEPKSVATFRGALQKQPRLSIFVRSPEQAFAKLQVTIRRTDSLTVLEQFERVEPGAVNVSGPLPATRLSVMLEADAWRFSKEVDLTAGSDEEVSFDLDPVILTGTIFLGRDPSPGHIDFLIGEGRSFRVEAGTEGRYDAVFWAEGVYAAKVTAAGETQPFVVPAVDVEQGAVADFHVPADGITVRVTDAKTGKSVPGATIGLESIWDDDQRGETTLSYRFVADSKGRASLRVRPGKASITVTSPGYAPSQPSELTVDSSEDRTIEVALMPTEVMARTRVLLPNGMGGAGAEACLVSGPLGDQMVWRAAADEAGNLEIDAAAASGVLVIRHANAASLALPLKGLPEVVRLTEPAAAPLLVRTMTSTGEPARFAAISLRVAGIRLVGAALAFYTWSQAPISDNRATWVGRNLPPQPLELLALRRPAGQLATGGYDALATRVTYPWPASAIEIILAD